MITSTIQNSKLIVNQYNPHIVIPEIAKVIGLEQAIVLQQVHYWLGKCGKQLKNELWIYNTFDQWKKQFEYWSLSTIKRIFYSLEKKGFIKSKKINAHKSNHTKWYTINYEKVKEVFEDIFTSKKIQNKNNSSDKILNVIQKKFRLSQIELSSCQIELIINAETIFTKKKYLSIAQSTIEEIFTKIDKDTVERKKTFFSIIPTSKEEKKVAKRMIKVWKEVFIKEKHCIFLREKLVKRLNHLWEKIFNQDIEKWEKFCLNINSSRFLMGEKKEGFKATFNWLIKEETVHRIMAGEFGIGDRIPDKQQEAAKQKNEEAYQKYQLEQKLLVERRLKEEREREIDILAERLSIEELRKLESTWTEGEFLNAQSAFDNYMKNGDESDPTWKTYKHNFDSFGINSPFKSRFFDEFKLKYYLKKRYKDFIEVAKVSIDKL